MWTKQQLRIDKSRFILPLFTAAVLSYFGYHIFHGAYGLESRRLAEQHIAALNSEYQALLKQNVLMKRRIALLRDGELEKDTVDEYARRRLNLSRANELTIITGCEDKSQ